MIKSESLFLTYISPEHLSASLSFFLCDSLCSTHLVPFRSSDIPRSFFLGSFTHFLNPGLAHSFSDPVSSPRINRLTRKSFQHIECKGLFCNSLLIIYFSFNLYNQQLFSILSTFILFDYGPLADYKLTQVKKYSIPFTVVSLSVSFMAYTQFMINDCLLYQ